MKEPLKKYSKLVLLIAGLALLSYFGWQAFDLATHKPAAPGFGPELSGEQIKQATAAWETDLSRWNNQFARKGFFALIGLFLALLGAVPKKRIWIPKLVFSSGLVALIIHHLLADGKISSIWAEGFSISVFWLLAAFIVKGTGMGCTVWRWKVLIEGQGFRIPLRHLVESFLIGRFIGSFAPGTSGLDGYRAYDIARYTGKVARSISVIFVEKLIGFFVLGTLLLVSVPIGMELFQANRVNATALVMMGLVFSGMMLLSLVILFKPGIIRWFLDLFIPKASPVRSPFEKAVKAVTAYEKHKLHLAKATLIGFGVHLCTIGMYFCTSRAIGMSPESDDLFVTSALMIGATILPLSIAGIGMREGVFAFFMGPAAAIYAFGGYLVGEVISLFGGPVWLARRGDYYEVLKAQRDAVNAGVDDDEAAPEGDAPGSALKPQGPLPDIRAYTATGASAGLLAGLGVGLLDAFRLWVISGSVDWTLPGYGALVYGLSLGIIGAGSGAALAVLGRLVKKPAAPRIRVGTFIGLSLFYFPSVAIGFFYVQRDLLGEKAGLFSPSLLGAVGGWALGSALVCLGLGWALRRALADRDKASHPLVGLGLYAAATAVLVILWLTAPPTGGGAKLPEQLAQEDAKRPNILLVMNDTMRADYAGVYGNDKGLTPHLDALAADGLVYDNAFAQSSWTRPSVATILTGRYASSHTAMLKGSVLPDEITTLAEALAKGGYENIGLVTNYNLTPFFNFDQGFHDYRYLAPNLPLFATDEQSKLIFIEVYKKFAAKFRGKKEVPEDYYVIGETVSQEALEHLDRRKEKRPFFMFLSYMDVHDPYFRHPFDGYGISHRTNQSPDESMIEEMKELYAGEVAYWDEQLGKLLGGLKKRRLYDDTLIVVVSDHGEEFGEHGGFWHGTTLYDEQLRVVFVVKPPASFGMGGGMHIPDWIGLVDVAPMILDNAGLPIPEEMQGSAKPRSARTPMFAEEDHQGNVLSSVRLMKDGAEMKVIEANEGNPRGLEPVELYDVASDPGESRNLAENAESLLSRMREDLEKHRDAASEGRARAQTGELNDAMKAKLDRLGYMEDEKDDEPKE